MSGYYFFEMEFKNLIVIHVFSPPKWQNDFSNMLHFKVFFFAFSWQELVGIKHLII